MLSSLNPLAYLYIVSLSRLTAPVRLAGEYQVLYQAVAGTVCSQCSSIEDKLQKGVPRKDSGSDTWEFLKYLLQEFPSSLSGNVLHKLVYVT